MHLNESLRLRRMARLVSNRSTVLDIGWAQTPNQYLNNKRVVGYDLSEKNPPKNYHTTIIGDANDLHRTIGEQRFSAILAGEILEHLPDPYGFLRQCHNVLTNNGVLVLSTPNPNSFIERALTLTLNRKYFYTTEHLCLYPQRWLIRILENSGFSDIRLFSGGFPVPPFGLVPFPRPWCHQTIALAVARPAA